MANMYYVVINGVSGGKRICSTKQEVDSQTRYAPNSKVEEFSTFEEANRFVNTVHVKKKRGRPAQSSSRTQQNSELNTKDEVIALLKEKGHESNNMAMVEAALIKLNMKYIENPQVVIDYQKYTFGFAIFKKNDVLVGYIDVESPSVAQHELSSVDKVSLMTRYEYKIKELYCSEHKLGYLKISSFDARNAESLIQRKL